MVNDLFGLWIAYGASRRNPQNWYYSNLTNDSHIYDKVNVSPKGKGFVGKGEARLSVTSSARYSQSRTTQDHDKCQAQGFMMSRFDWRDVEITGLVRFIRAGRNAKVAFFARSGDITRPCEATGYGIEITPDGITTCSVRQFHPGGTTELDHSHEDKHDIEGQLIGFKVCIFNNPENNHVMLQGFIDKHANGQWKMVCSVTDTGLGIHGDRCSNNKNQVITWGGPLAVFTMSGDNVEDFDEEGNVVVLPTEVEVTNLSVREIDPFNKFGQGGGITGAGFHIDRPITITPDPIIIDPPPAPFEPPIVEELDDVTNPDIINHLTAVKNQRRAIAEITKTNRNALPPTIFSHLSDRNLAPLINKNTGSYAAGNASMILYKKTGRTATMVEGPFKTRHYASGKPDDVTKEWNGQLDTTWKNYTVCFYVTITSIEHDDAISTKLYGPSHSDGNCCWYIFDTGFQRGNCWFAFEHPHPSTSKTADPVGPPIGSIIGRKVGFQIVISQVGTGAKVEAWIDNGDGIWRKHSEKLNIGGKSYAPAVGHRPQIRIDAAPGIIMHDVKLWENTPNLEFVGTDGSGLGPVAPPDFIPIPDWGDIGDSGIGGGVVIGDPNSPPPSGGTPPPTGGGTTTPPVMSKPYTGGLGRLTAQLTGKAVGGTGSSVGNVVFNDGTAPMPVENWNDLSDADKATKRSVIETIPFGTMFMEDSTIHIRKDNLIPEPPSNYFGVTVDYVRFKNGTKQIITDFNNLLDDPRFEKSKDIATIPYGTMIYEDASIGVYKSPGAGPPPGYTGKVASYTTAINPNISQTSTTAPSTVTATVNGTIVGVGNEETRATFSGQFKGSLNIRLLGDIQGTIEGSGQGVGNTADGNKTGRFYAEMTGTVQGNGTAVASGQVEGIFTGVSVPVGGGGTGGTGNTGSGNTGGGTGTPTPNKQEPSPVYVEKKLQVIWAIDSMEGDPCNINSPYEDTALEEVFNAAPDDVYVETRSYRKIGVYVNRPASKLIGKKVRNVKVIMNKEGLSTLQGTVFLRIRSANRQIVEEFPDVIDASLITGEDVTYEFTHHEPMHTIERGDFIYLEYPAGGNLDNFIRVKITESDKADGESSCLVTYDGLNEVINVDRDPAFIISV